MPPLPRIGNGEFCYCCCWNGCVVGLFAAGTTDNWSGSGGLTHSSFENALEKCRKHSPAPRVFYIPLVFSNARRVL